MGTVGRRQATGGDAASTGTGGALALPLPGFHAALGLEYLGGGVARAGYVMLDPSLVLKVAHRERTRCHNLAEARAYAEAPEHIKRWLAPVVDCADDGSWLVVERARCGSDLTYTERVQACNAVNDAIGRWFFDLHEGNVGIMPDGRYVATDYGFGPMRELGESDSDSHPLCPTGDAPMSDCACTTCNGASQHVPLCSNGWRLDGQCTTDHAKCPSGDRAARCGCPTCLHTPSPTGEGPGTPGCPCDACMHFRSVARRQAAAVAVARAESAARWARLRSIRRMAAEAQALDERRWAGAPSLPF